jgi:hypothetical protein
VFVGTVPDPANAKALLEAAAGVVFAPRARFPVLGAAATVSCSFSAGSALIALRYVAASRRIYPRRALLPQRRTNAGLATTFGAVAAASLRLDFAVATPRLSLSSRSTPRRASLCLSSVGGCPIPRVSCLAGGFRRRRTAALLRRLAASTSHRELLVSLASAPGAILALSPAAGRTSPRRVVAAFLSDPRVADILARMPRPDAVRLILQSLPRLLDAARTVRLRAHAVLKFKVGAAVLPTTVASTPAATSRTRATASASAPSARRWCRRSPAARSASSPQRS